MSVHTFSTRVLIAGQEVPASNISWECEAGNDLPGRLSTSTGLGQRTAKVEWENTRPVSSGWNPWDSDYPAPGKKAEIFVTVDKKEHKVFTGVIDTTDTSVYGVTTSRIVDYSDDFSKVVTVEPLLERMPGRRNTTYAMLSPGAHIRFVIDQVLRYCGYTTAEGSLSASSGAANNLHLYAPLNGTFWTDWASGEGALDEARRTKSGANTTLPVFVNLSDGDVYLQEGYAQWGKSPQPTLGSGKALTMRTRVYVGHTGTADFTTEFAIGGNVTLRVAGRDVSVLVNGVRQNKGLTLPNRTCWVGLELRGSDYSLYYDEGAAVAVGQFTGVQLAGDFIDKFRVEATGLSRVSHFSVRITGVNSSPLFALQRDSKVFSESRRAVVNLPVWARNVTFTPSVRYRAAKDVLQEICEALCCMMWFDGDGVFHLEHAEKRRATNTVGELSVSNMVEAPVKSDLLMGAPIIRVKSTRGVLTRTKNQQGASVTLWQGGGESLTVGETLETFVEVPEDEEWFEVDTTFARWENNTSHVNDIKNQSGSVYVTEMAGQWWGDNDFTCETVTPFVYKMTCKSNQNAIVLQIPRQVPEIPSFLGGQSTPILRGGAKLKKVANSVSVAVTDAIHSPEIEHDMGAWGQEGIAREVAQQVAKYCGSSAVTYLRQVRTFLSPYVDVGQTLVLDLLEPYGKKFKVLVLGVSHNVLADSTALTIRVVEDVTGWSYAELERSRASYAALESSASYAALEAK